MGRHKLEKTLYCHMNDQFVGTLTSRRNNLSFRYSDSWLNSKFARAISVSMPLTDQEYSGADLLAGPMGNTFRSDTDNAYFKASNIKSSR